MSPQERYETIEAYLDGRLSGSALVDFEAQLQTDADLVAQVNLLRDIDNAVSPQATLDFQRLVQEEGDAFIKKKAAAIAPVREIRSRRWYWGVAASLLFIVASYFVWRMNMGTPSGEQLYASYYQVYPLNSSIRSGDASDTQFQQAIQQYQAKAYEQAAALLQQLVEANPKDMTLAFCLANAYLNQQLPRFEKAETQFRRILADGKSIYVPRAQWYLALLLLQQDQIKEAKTLLKDLASGTDNLSQSAKEILGELGDE